MIERVRVVIEFGGYSLLFFRNDYGKVGSLVYLLAQLSSTSH